MFRSLGRLLPSLRSAAHPFSHALHRPPAFATAPLSSAVPPNKQPFTEDFSKMTNEELVDTSTIPGWDLVVNPPRNWPRGALVGTVVSTRMQKTINVAVDRYRIVHKIKKRKRYTRKFFAHDEDEVANLGDMVMIAPCQRITRHKHFVSGTKIIGWRRMALALTLSHTPIFLFILFVDAPRDYQSQTNLNGRTRDCREEKAGRRDQEKGRSSGGFEIDGNQGIILTKY